MVASPKIRILIVDDHFVVRMGLAASISMEGDMEIVAESSNGQQAIEMCERHQPDVILMDLRMPGLSGVETTTILSKNHPRAHIIILSTFDGDEDVHKALQAGARAYLLKTVLRDELVRAIRSVHAGHRYIPQAIASRLAEHMERSELSAREYEVLRLIVQGMSNKEIAVALSIGEVTVKLHVSNLLTKLGVHDRTQAVMAALQRGIVHLD